MKKLRITVRGISYEVLVEVLEDTDDGGQKAAAPRVPGAGRRRHSQGPAPAPTPAVEQRPAGEGANTIAAPIAGTVKKLFVAAGDDVEEKAPVILLDAMKMDTYIYAPRKGCIAEVCVAPEDCIQIGTPLIRYEPEG